MNRHMVEEAGSRFFELASSLGRIHADTLTSMADATAKTPLGVVFAETAAVHATRSKSETMNSKIAKQSRLLLLPLSLSKFISRPPPSGFHRTTGFRFRGPRAHVIVPRNRATRRLLYRRMGASSNRMDAFRAAR